MIEEVNRYDFEDKFNTYFSGMYKNNFSHEGKTALFEYLENYEEDTGEQINLDIVALCCDYSEYKDLKDFNKQYGGDYKSLEEIEENTTLIRIEGEESFIIHSF